jgi:hypothetical protein
VQSIHATKNGTKSNASFIKEITIKKPKLEIYDTVTYGI